MGIKQASSMGIGGAWEASSVRGQALLASGMSVAASGAMEQHEQRARSMGIENGHGHNMGSKHHMGVTASPAMEQRGQLAGMYQQQTH